MKSWAWLTPGAPWPVQSNQTGEIPVQLESREGQEHTRMNPGACSRVHTAQCAVKRWAAQVVILCHGCTVLTVSALHNSKVG